MAVADIIVTPCRILYAVPGSTAPADTVAAGGAWPAAWTELGYTAVPLTLEFKREVVEADIQESLTVIQRTAKKESLIAETSLAELTMANTVLSFGGTVSATPAGASQPAKDVITGGDTTALTEREWGFEGKYVSAAGNTHPIRIYIWKAIAEFGAKLEFGKEKAGAVTLRIVANPDMTKAAGQRLYSITKITAPASS
jgi:hypothetical protein